MGNKSSSEVTQIIDTKNITKNDLAFLNQQITNATTQQISKAQTQSGSAIMLTAHQHVGPIIARGRDSKIEGVTLSIDQNTEIQLKTDDSSIQNNSISTELAMAIITQVGQKIDNDNMAKLMASSEAQQSLGALSATAGNSVSSEINARVTTLNLTENYRKF